MTANEAVLHERVKKAQKLAAIGHRTAFNNEQSPYRIVSYKRPQNHKCETIQMRNLTA